MICVLTKKRFRLVASCQFHDVLPVFLKKSYPGMLMMQSEIVLTLRHEITDRWPAVLVLWRDQLLRLESTRERSLLRRSRLPDQRKSRSWHPEILSKDAALQPMRFSALSRASKSASYNFH